MFVCRPQGRVSLCGQQGGCTIGREEFVEALLILYQECTSPELMKIHNVANFVKKCKHTFYTVVAFLLLFVDVCFFCDQSIFFLPHKLIQSALYQSMESVQLMRHAYKWF